MRKTKIDMNRVVGSHDILFICLDADAQLGRLFEGWKSLRGDTFVICCSDHGTCYGEDGCWSHGISHPMVYTIPYKHFFL